MKEISLVFPNQLYEKNDCLKKGREVFLLEDELFFHQYSFHQQKLLLHRASMQAYRAWLEKNGFVTSYINSTDSHHPLKELFKSFPAKNITTIHLTETIDYLLERRLKRYATRFSVQLVNYPSPNFICSSAYLNEYFYNKKRYFLTNFYIDQRKRLEILLEKGGPLGGKWTYDEENRKKLPAGKTVPGPLRLKGNIYLTEARQYIMKNFAGNYGSSDGFNYPVTFKDAELGLDDFLKERFSDYGIYQDAIDKEDSRLFHSLLTPALNIGLLDPLKIIDRSISYALDNNVQLNSLEGFVRQVIGWREYIRAVYEREGVKQRTTNFWNFNRKIPDCFWTATTGIEPVDTIIKRLLKTGYSNHIERLMMLGNFMCLCEFDPNEVYRWFMTLYIDAYDWVMVPNVYGMSQYADGGLMSTKPYISGSNYILKMSNFKKGDWCETWDGLFWRFMHVHREFFYKNPRLSMLITTFDKMPVEKRNKHLQMADIFLAQLKTQ